MIKLNNIYYFLRHGEAFSNIEPRWISSWPEIKISHLTPAGRKRIRKISKDLKKIGLNLIFSSDLARTRETAEIIAQILKKQIHFTKKLRELDFGIFNGLHPDVYWVYFQNPLERFTKKIPHGETLEQCSRRMFNFFLKINRQYRNKKILIISHADPLWLLESRIKQLNKRSMIAFYSFRLKPGELRRFKQAA